LEDFGAQATPAIPVLMEMLRKAERPSSMEYNNIVCRIVRTLRAIGPEAMNTLLGAMAEPALLKNEVMIALAAYGAVSEVIELLQSGPTPVRQAAVQGLHYALRRLSSEDTTKLQAIRTALERAVEDEDSDVRASAKAALTLFQRD
jgi:hypothetical protein